MLQYKGGEALLAFFIALKRKRVLYMVSSQVVANTILRSAFKEKVSISPMKLQKLMYFFFKEYAQKSGEKIFSESFEVWKYGPVLPSIYYEFSSFRANPITRFARNAQGNVLVINFSKNPTLETCWNNVWAKYKNLTGPQLSEITHKAGSAWRKARDNNSAVLDFEDIKNE